MELILTLSKNSCSTCTQKAASFPEEQQYWNPQLCTRYLQIIIKLLKFVGVLLLCIRLSCATGVVQQCGAIVRTTYRIVVVQTYQLR